MCFCLENVIKTKSVIVYPNNKPWVNKNLKECLNKKKHAFIKGNIEDYKEKEREYRQAAFRAKIEYKNKVEEKFGSGNIRDTWAGLKTMMGVTNKGCKQTLPVHNDFTKKANELNIFYSRFDVRDTKKECDDLCDTLVPEHVDDVCVEEVKKVFSSIKKRKVRRTRWSSWQND